MPPLNINCNDVVKKEARGLISWSRYCPIYSISIITQGT
jgi:hypothetical protein